MKVRSPWLVAAVALGALLAIGGAMHLGKIDRTREHLRGEILFLEGTVLSGRTVQDNLARYENALERADTQDEALNELLRDVAREHPCFVRHLPDWDVRLPEPRGGGSS